MHFIKARSWEEADKLLGQYNPDMIWIFTGQSTNGDLSLLNSFVQNSSADIPVCIISEKKLDADLKEKAYDAGAWEIADSIAELQAFPLKIKKHLQVLKNHSGKDLNPRTQAPTSDNNHHSKIKSEKNHSDIYDTVEPWKIHRVMDCIKRMDIFTPKKTENFPNLLKDTLRFIMEFLTELSISGIELNSGSEMYYSEPFQKSDRILSISSSDNNNRIIFNLDDHNGKTSTPTDEKFLLSLLGNHLLQFLENQNLKFQYSLFQAIAEQSQYLISIKKMDGNWIYINSRFIEKTGYSLSDLNAKDMFGEQVSLYTPRFDEINKSISSGKVWLGEIMSRDKKGRTFWQKLLVSPLTMENQVTYLVSSGEDITRQKRTEQRLKESVKKMENQSEILNTMTRMMTDMVYYKDKDLRYIFSSEPHCESILQCSTIEYIGKTDEEIAQLALKNGHQFVFRSVYERIDQDAIINKNPHLYLEKGWVNGEETHLEISITPIFKESIFHGIIGVARNVSNRIKSEIQHREIEQKYRMLVENIKSSITIHDYEGRILFANKTAAETFAFTPEEMTGKYLHDYLPEKIADTYLQQFHDVFEKKEEKTGEITLNINDRAASFEYDIQPLPDLDGNVYVVMNIETEITEKKKIRNYMDVEQNISYLQSFSEGLSHTVQQIFKIISRWEWIDSGGLYLLNKKKNRFELTEHFGLNENFVEGVRYIESNDPRFELVVKKQPVYLSYSELQKLTQKSDNTEDLKIIAVLPLVHDNELIGILVLSSHTYNNILSEDRLALESIASRISHVITLTQVQDKLKESNKELNSHLEELKEKQLLLIQKSKLESLGELAAGMAHEINQPLGIISLALENILYKLNKQQFNQSYLESKFNTISDNIDKIQQIIEHVRLFSRGQMSSSLERIEVDSTIRNALLLIGEQYGKHDIELITNLNCPDTFTIGNRHKLEQVIHNLLSNARYAVEAKSTFKAASLYKKQIIINTSISSDKILIQISDNGVGISSKNLEKIFNPFFTTKPEGVGTGLGLSVVYGIIKEMEGEISVESTENKSTSIQIKLPLYFGKNI